MDMSTVLTCFLVLCICQANALECYNCKGVDVLTNCTTKVTCNSDEHCHARKYIFNGRNVLYDVNCRPLTLCSRIEAKRREVADITVLETSDIADIADIELWTSCCASSLCNRDFDSEGYLNAKKALTCHSCKDITDPADCTQTTTCKTDEACFTHEKISGTKRLFDMSCLKKQVCKGIGYHLQISRKRHTKRFELCRACCDANDKCNNQFCSVKLGQTGMGALGTPVVPVHTTVAAHTTTTPSPSKPNANSYIEIIKGPDTVSTRTGTTVTFTCHVGGDPEPTVTWEFLHNSPYPQKVTSGVTKTTDGSQLVIQNVGHHSAGVYECVASNGVGTKRGLAVLDVK